VIVPTLTDALEGSVEFPLSVVEFSPMPVADDWFAATVIVTVDAHPLPSDGSRREPVPFTPELEAVSDGLASTFDPSPTGLVAEGR
jgi:hypothetical protein